MRTSTSSESQPQYIEHIGGVGHQVKTSFGSQVRRTSLSGGQLSAPSLGVREGAGLLGPQGVKSALRLQASPRAAAERERMGKVEEDQEDEGDAIDELADDASTTSEGVQEKWFSTFLPACLLPLLLPRLLLSQEMQRALWVLQILSSQHTSRAIRSIHSCTLKAIPHSNYPRSTSRPTRNPPLSRPSPPLSPCLLYVRPPLRRATRRPALARSMPT